MRFIDRLPTPSVEALAHSQQLVQRIHDAIEHQGGSIAFRQFMHMALYEPGLGYYVAGLAKIGAAGDFTTAPELSPLFAQCLAHSCAALLQELGHGSVLELGAGSGSLAAELLLQLERLACLPDYYFILDLSPDLKQRQLQTLQTRAPHLLERVRWLEQLPEQPFPGILLANEVLDAMPVELFTLQQQQAHPVHVYHHQGQLVLQPHPESYTLPVHIALNHAEYAEGYTSEFNPLLAGWIQSLAQCLSAGALLLIDYGYEQTDYYHPQRQQGTLLCHYQQRVHDDPLFYPGLQDITASVDFSAVAQAGKAAGLALGGYVTQASFLMDAGLEALFNTAWEQADARGRYQLAQQVRVLTLPAEMGERFRVMALTKHFTSVLPGFRLTDRRHRL